MYAAVLSGCIPVLFDGGIDDFPDEPTWWAWRRGDRDSGPSGGSEETSGVSGSGAGRDWALDYHSFAVIFNASSIRSGAVDFVEVIVQRYRLVAANRRGQNSRIHFVGRLLSIPRRHHDRSPSVVFPSFFISYSPWV
jgi:hypothetical protein